MSDFEMSPQQFTSLWDKLAKGVFTEAEVRTIDINGIAIKVLLVPRNEKYKPIVYLPTLYPFYACPRFSAYKHRFALIPVDILGGASRWEVKPSDIAGYINWAVDMNHVVTFSTFKSGASMPFNLHAQSFPLKRKSTGIYLIKRIFISIFFRGAGTAGLYLQACPAGGRLQHLR